MGRLETSPGKRKGSPPTSFHPLWVG